MNVSQVGLSLELILKCTFASNTNGEDHSYCNHEITVNADTISQKSDTQNVFFFVFKTVCMVDPFNYE